MESKDDHVTLGSLAGTNHMDSLPPFMSEQDHNSLDIYQRNTKHQKSPSMSQMTNYDAPDKQLKQQKIWCASHSIIWLLTTIITIPFLIQKQYEINEFYDKSQCCYCLWAGHQEDISMTGQHKIEWSPCINIELQYVSKPNKHNAQAVCINDNNIGFCNVTNPIIVYANDILDNIIGEHHDKFSTTSSIFGIRFHKWYVYYGIISIICVIIFGIILWISLYYKAILSEKLFIGNMMLTINCYYSYIKLYQYSKKYYGLNSNCPQPIPIFKNNQINSCYESVLDPIYEDVLGVNVIYLTLYFIYCIYAIKPD
eukprot:206914_1